MVNIDKLKDSDSSHVFIFYPTNKWHRLDFTRNEIIFHSSQVLSIEIDYLRVKSGVYIVTDLHGCKHWLNCRAYRLTVGVSSREFLHY